MKLPVPEPAKQQATFGLALLAFMAMPFTAAGLGVLLFMAAPMAYDCARMHTWISVPAQVDSAALQTHRSSKGSPAYSVSVRYRYQVAGAEYTGMRAAITQRGDNIGNFQEELGERLQNAQRTGAPIQVWVNPAEPAESVVDRSLRPGLLALLAGMGLVFSAFGGIAMFWATLQLLRRRRGSAPV